MSEVQIVARELGPFGESLSCVGAPRSQICAEILADGNELHLRRDNALARIPRLRHRVPRLRAEVCGRDWRNFRAPLNVERLRQLATCCDELVGR